MLPVSSRARWTRLPEDGLMSAPSLGRSVSNQGAAIITVSDSRRPTFHLLLPAARRLVAHLTKRSCLIRRRREDRVSTVAQLRSATECDHVISLCCGFLVAIGVDSGLWPAERPKDL